MVKRDVAYDYIRIIAMLAILMCHFFQVRSCYAAFSWLNIGVQVFLVLSAKLLCQKDVATPTQIVTFYKTRLLRICLPVWIYLACLVPVLFVVGRCPTLSAIVLYAVGMAGFAPSGILGLGHFWFITVLLLCYLLVPVLNHIELGVHGESPWKGVLLKATPAAVVVLIFAMTQWVHFGVNMALFIIAYFYFRTMGNQPHWSRMLTLRLLPFVVAAIGMRLYMDSLVESEPYLYELVVTATKAVLGMFLFALFHLLFSRMGNTRTFRGITLLSNASYEVYIVHQFILLALYEYVPLFRKLDLLGGLAMLGTALLLIAANAAVLYIAKIKIECGLRRCTRRRK